MVCAFLHRFWSVLRGWFRKPSSGRTASTTRLEAGLNPWEFAKIEVEGRWKKWRKIANPYHWSNYGYNGFEKSQNQLFEEKTIVVYSDASHLPNLDPLELAVIDERINYLKQCKKSGKQTSDENKELEKSLTELKERKEKQEDAAIGIYMGDLHPLELSFRIGKRKDSFKAECVAIAVGLHRLYCWPNYHGERVVFRTDCLWAISTLKKWAAKQSPDLKHKDGTKYNLDNEDVDNLNYLNYVASRFPNKVVLQYVRSHTFKPDPGLSKADELATKANRCGQGRNDKEEISWNAVMHQHIISGVQNAVKNWNFVQEQKWNAMQRSKKLRDEYCKIAKETAITRLLKDDEMTLISAFQIDYLRE